MTPSQRGSGPSALETFTYAAHMSHSVGDETHFLGGLAQPTMKEYEHIDPASPTSILAPSMMREFHLQTTCVYCGTQMRVLSEPYAYHGARSDGYGKKVGFRCFSCGWWLIQVKGTTDDDEVDVIRHHLHTYEGIICHFEPAPWRTALLHASEELGTWQRSLGELSSRDMERFVQRIFRQYYECDVHHVGRSGDRGVDLILVRADKPVAVQVKHRRVGGGAEGVAALRDFVGALVGEGFQQGVFVTTARRFTRPARQYADRVTRQFAPLNLVTVRELRELVGNLVYAQWEEYDRVWAAWE